MTRTSPAAPAASPQRRTTVVLGIPVPVLDAWLREAIDALQDSACRAAFEREQESERERLGEVTRAALDSP